MDIDEPEPAAAPHVPEALLPKLGRDDQSLDRKIDLLTEEALLRGMERSVPEEAKVVTNEERSSSAGQLQR